MEDNYSRTARIVKKESIYVQSKKEYCISNNIEKLGPVRKRQDIEKFRKTGTAMIDLGRKVVFFSTDDERFRV